MDRNALQGFFRLGMFIGGCGLVMVFLQKPGSAEFVLSVCSTLIGAAIMLGVVLLVRADFFGWLVRMAARRAEDDRPSASPEDSPLNGPED